MDKFSEIFNFDNIGGKIKNFARYSCWITIWLIWIAALIAFIILLRYEWLARFCWIPLVSAIVGPFFVWIGSWAVYAFGELAEDVHAMRKKYYPKAEEKVDQEAEEKARREAEEKARRMAEEKARREAKAKIVPTDAWTCSCGYRNNATDKRCSNCYRDYTPKK